MSISTYSDLNGSRSDRSEFYSNGTTPSPISPHAAGASTGGAINRDTYQPHYSRGPNVRSGASAGVPSVEELSKKSRLLSLKEFLEFFGPHLTDEFKAIEKYSEYKTAFLDHHLIKFFNTHKNEEWFLEKYHPDIKSSYIKSNLDNIRERYKVFVTAYLDGKLNSLTLDDLPNLPPLCSNSLSSHPSLDSSSGIDDTGSNADRRTTMDEDIDETSDGETDVNDRDFKRHPSGGGVGSGSSLQPSTTYSSTSSHHPSLSILNTLIPSIPTIIIKSIHPSIKRSQLLDIVRPLKGFRELILGDPSAFKRFHRLGWIHFDTGTEMSAIEEALKGAIIDGFELHCSITKTSSPTLTPKIKIASEEYSSEERLRTDLKLVKKLAKHFDKQRSLDNPILDPMHSGIHAGIGGSMGLSGLDQPTTDAMEESIEDESEIIEEGEESEIGHPAHRQRRKCKLAQSSLIGINVDPDVSDIELVKKQLDLLVLYLRIVHTVCYYCPLHVNSVEELYKECGHLHLRRLKDSEGQTFRDKGTLLKDHDEKIEDLIKRPLIVSALTESSGFDEPSAAEVDKGLTEQYIQFIEEGDPKSRCKICSKLFKGPEFVLKHLHLKHEPEAAAIKSEKILLRRFLNNTEDWTAHLLSWNAYPSQHQQQQSPMMMSGGTGHLYHHSGQGNRYPSGAGGSGPLRGGARFGGMGSAGGPYHPQGYGGMQHPHQQQHPYGSGNRNYQNNYGGMSGSGAGGFRNYRTGGGMGGGGYRQGGDDHYRRHQHFRSPTGGSSMESDNMSISGSGGPSLYGQRPIRSYTDLDAPSASSTSSSTSGKPSMDFDYGSF